MGEDTAASDGSWKKIVLSKSNNQWFSTVKTAPFNQAKTMNTSNFSLNNEIQFVPVKIENEDSFESSDLAENDSSEATESVRDNFMCEVTPIYRKEKGFPINSVIPQEYDNDSISSYQNESQSSAAIASSINNFLDGTAKRRRRNGSGSKSETPIERAVRLAKMSAYAAQRLANETPEQRANRLKRMSEYAAKRLSQETQEQRAKRLARMSAYAAKRLSEETREQRQARLARMSAYAAKRQAMKKFLGSNNPESQYSQS